MKNTLNLITMFALIAAILIVPAYANETEVVTTNVVLETETNQSLENETLEISENETKNETENETLEDIFGDEYEYDLTEKINETQLTLPTGFSRIFARVGDFFASEEQRAKRALERVEENKIRILKMMQEKESGLYNSPRFSAELERLQEYVQEDVDKLEEVINENQDLDEISQLKARVLAQNQIDRRIANQLNRTIQQIADLDSNDLEILKRVQERSSKITQEVEKRLRENELNTAARMIASGVSIDEIKQRRQQAIEKNEEFKVKVQERREDLVEKAQERREDLVERAQERREDLVERREDLVEKAQERREDLVERRENLREKNQERREDLVEKAQERREDLVERREDLREKNQERRDELIEEFEELNEEIEIEVEIKDTFSEVEYELNGIKEDLILNITDKEDILAEISKLTNLSVDEITKYWKVEYDLEDESDNDVSEVNMRVSNNNSINSTI